MYTIIGSGFGLYGYLPAIINGLGDEVILPKKYSDFICSRSDLAEFKDKVIWVDNQKVSIEKSNTVIIAVPPIKQSIMIKKCLEFKNIKNIFLEKPLAQSPIESSMILNILNTSKVNYAINYSFIYLELLHKKLLSVNLKCELNLNWEFMAHHYIKIWIPGKKNILMEVEHYVSTVFISLHYWQNSVTKI